MKIICKMEEEHQMNGQILRLKQEIQEDFPELSKYQEEMYVELPDTADQRITRSELQEYCNLLGAMRDGYAAAHPFTSIRE